MTPEVVKFLMQKGVMTHAYQIRPSQEFGEEMDIEVAVSNRSQEPLNQKMKLESISQWKIEKA